MDHDEPGWPLIDDFFRAEAEGRSTATARRYDRVRSRLYDFLDTADMTLGLGSHCAVLLESERQFHQTGAFWTLFGVDELACCLPSFVHETWLPASNGEARTQISLVGRLLPRLGSSCGRPEAEAAVARARREVAERPAGETGSPRMPDRFRRQEGPRW
ncbi:hypothetical protein [Aeromicrobium sp. Root472D3]|uniref:hypothetical protein n=1 Tax=Aeromicrobium sp. Root472D3 TaxID=1736540 RepID=UPI0006FCCFF3|nr:hypothetical protein [Aeromicrobium sp. Root472D3]KQX75555.1 hypothetical protein ASD10_10425 [Aeromicrobium sp. Root472D3]